MNGVNVYAPTTPLLCKSAHAQRDTLKKSHALLEKRFSFIRTPLKPFAAGDKTTVHFKGQVITVEAERITPIALQWRVKQVAKPA